MIFDLARASRSDHHRVMDAWGLGRIGAATCLVLVTGGCVKSGQTGSPAEDPPQYETPGRFSPEEGGGTPGGNPGVDSGNTPYRQGGDFAALLDDTHLVVAAGGRGLLVFDVSEPGEPSLVGELRVIGQPLQLELDVAARVATLALEERTPIDEETIPDEPLPTSRQRIVTIDLSDPTRPERIAHVDVGGEFWQFERRGARYFVLALLNAAADAACENGGFDPLGYGPGPRAMQVTGYELGANGFSELGVVELPTDGRYAFMAGDAYFAVADYHGTPPDRTPSLGWVDFGTGTLVEGGGVPLTGELRALAREGSTLVALVEDGTDDALALHTFVLDGAGGAAARGQIAVAIGTTAIALLPGAQQAIVSGESAAIVDLSDPVSPRIAHEFAAEVQHVVAVPQGLLAIGGSREEAALGRLAASLWDASDADALISLGRVVAPWGRGVVIGPPDFTVDAERGLLLLPIFVNDALPGLGVVSFDANGPAVHSQQAARERPYRPVTNGTSVFSASFEGLEVLPLVQGASEDTPVSLFERYFERQPIDLAELDGVQLALSERASDGRFTVAPFNPGASADAGDVLELDHFAEALVGAGDRVIALGLRWDSECEYIDEPAPDGSASFDRCADHRRRGISVLALEDGVPRVVESFAIDSELDVEPAADVRAETAWSGYVVLGDGRLAFPVEQRLTCGSYESCEALGVPASETRAAPGCNPQVQNCAELPTEEIIISGSKSSLLLYVLEGVGGDAPELVIATRIAGRFTLPNEGPLDVGWQFLAHGDDLGIVREEQLYDENGNGVSNEHGDAIVRFWLERIVAGDGGSLDVPPSVSTPGRPVAWIGEHVYALEPTYTRGGDVFVRAHRARLKDDGAFIEDSAEIGAGFLDARAVGDRLFVVRGPADPCAPDPSVDLFALALDSDVLAAGESLALPGRGWSFPYGAATSARGDLLLRGGPSGYAGLALVDIGEPDMPRVVRYTDHPVE